MSAAIIIIECIMSALIGFVIGVKHHHKPVGTLRVDQSDPDDNPYLFLELSGDPKKLPNQKYITLKVNIENYISHK